MQRRAVRRVTVNIETPGERAGTRHESVARTLIRQGIEREAAHFGSILDKHSVRLIRWGGIASICGGITWILFVTLIHLDWYIAVPQDTFYDDAFNNLFEKLLLIPLLLFICTATGMLALQRPRPSAYLSMFLVLAGLGLSTVTTVWDYWLGHRWDSWNGWGPDLIPTSGIDWWLPSIAPGLFVLALGLVVLSITNGTIRRSPWWETFCLIASLISIFILWFQYDSNLTWGASALFGLGWFLLGIAFPRKNRKNYRK